MVWGEIAWQMGSMGFGRVTGGYEDGPTVSYREGQKMTDTKHAVRNCPPLSCRALCLAGWNALLIVAGLALIGLIGEAWLRLTTPFVGTYFPKRFVLNVGILGKPNTKVRWTNNLDFWTVSQTNSLGFLDHEPLGPEQAAASCHITMIGDSFVEAKEVPLADKSHVQLEDLASRHLPHLNITTTAFGVGGTGQINQLPYYDEFVRHLYPKLLVLVFVSNDFQDNSPVLSTVQRDHDPDHVPHLTAVRGENGTITLRPPDPDYRTFQLSQARLPWYAPLRDWSVQRLYVIAWMQAKRRAHSLWRRINDGASVALTRTQVERVELLKRHPAYTALLRGWQPTTLAHIEGTAYGNSPGPPVMEEAAGFTAFALDQFKERAERDSVSLVILLTYTMGARGSFLSDRIRTLAHARKIPTIDQYDYIVRRGERVETAHWAHDKHWSPIGHQWAAEALLEYLKQNQELCDSGRHEVYAADERKDTVPT